MTGHPNQFRYVACIRLSNSLSGINHGEKRFTVACDLLVWNLSYDMVNLENRSRQR